MHLQQRIDLLAELGHFLKSGGDDELDQAIQQSYLENKWFTEENTRKALNAIANEFMDKAKLEAWAAQYPISKSDFPEKTVWIIRYGPSVATSGRWGACRGYAVY